MKTVVFLEDAMEVLTLPEAKDKHVEVPASAMVSLATEVKRNIIK